MYSIRRTAISLAVFLTASVILMARGAAAQTTGYGVLYSFKGGVDGAEPNGVTLGENGKVYGTTFTGGTNTCGLNIFYGCGTVFELSPAKSAAWTKTVLFNFSGPDGALPSRSMNWGTGPGPVFDAKGVLYGTTQAGGIDDPGGNSTTGTVFALAPPTVAGGSWTESVLLTFTGNPQTANLPYGGLLISSSGELYGTAFTDDFPQGGYFQGGAVFQLTPPAVPGGSWTPRTLVNLETAGVGMLPMAGVVGLAGSLYGTTYEDAGFGGCGTVYEAAPSVIAGGAWSATLIHDFGGGPPSDGCEPVAPVTAGPGGVLYGTTLIGGSGTACSLNYGGCGTIFLLTPPTISGGAWTETVIYNFSGTSGDGAYPGAGVVLGKNGVLYGTTTYGGNATSGSPCTLSGVSGCGTVFALSPPTTPGGAWTETILHSFTGQNGDGSNPGPLFLNRATGALYGATRGGGFAGQGTIFAVKP